MPALPPQPGFLPGEPDRFDGDDPTWAVAASHSKSDSTESTGQPTSSTRNAVNGQPFVPREPKSLDEAGLRQPQVEALVLKFLLNTGRYTGREIAQQLGLPFGTIEPLLHRMKADQLVVFHGGSFAGDYSYELTPQGIERARSHAAQSTYFGSAPVPLDAYVASVEAQSARHEQPRLADLRQTLSSLVLSDAVLLQIGEALNLGLGFFLHGSPGNGKTSIAERVTAVYGDGIWIPRAIQAGGEVMRVYDPAKHETLPWNEDLPIDADRIDARWVYIRRPTIVVGGELRMENLEINTNPVTGISEAPLQVKANCGTLVIDDFGRQKFPIDELLNRLIIPLEKRYDILNLPSGRSFNIPFDQLIVFSTNLPPKSLVDEAFLRRIPFTIHAQDPSEAEFREVFEKTANDAGLQFGQPQIDHLLEAHYHQTNRPLRFCHPRDIVRQILNSCEFAGTPKVITNEILDRAMHNCLAIRIDT